MVYKAIGITSGNTLVGLEIIYVHFQERGGQWTYESFHTARYEYTTEWLRSLRGAAESTAREYILLDQQFGQLIGYTINQFIQENNLTHRVDLVASAGHRVFDEPSETLTGEIGDGASIAAITGLPVISSLHAIDVALGGKGAPLLSNEAKLFDDNLTVPFKAPLIVALHGVLRWREEYTMIASETGASRNSIGGALWLGGEA